MTVSERPGVYTSYQVESLVSGGGRGGAVGLAAAAEGGTVGRIVSVTSYAEAVSAFGGGNLVRLIEILLRNGAGHIYACPVAEDEYDAAFAALMSEGEIRYMVCDSRDATVHSKLKAAILDADEAGKYRIGIVETDHSTRAELVSAAEELNCERMVMVSHHEAEGCPGSVAAAVCGLMAGESDPAVPLNGGVLRHIGSVGGNFSDSDITLLVRGGVTPLETVGGELSVIRGITTRTSTGGAADATWREVNTVLIVDEVLPGIRDSLRTGFARAKNTAQSRGAIRTRVIIALEEYLAREIIDGYEDVAVTALESDPTVCQVSFGFTVAHGLNRIELKAHITV